MNWISENKKLFVWLVLISLVLLDIILMLVVGYTMENYEVVNNEIVQNPTKIMIMSFLSGTLGGAIIGVIIKGSGEWLDGKPDVK